MQVQTSDTNRHPAAGGVNVAERQRDPGRYDSAARRRAKRSGREKGCWTYIPLDELEAAGFSPGDPPPFYTTRGYQRSANGRTVTVSLYREP